MLDAMSRLGGHKIGHSNFAGRSATARNPMKPKTTFGGRDRDRTGDPLLAKRKLGDCYWARLTTIVFCFLHV